MSTAGPSRSPPSSNPSGTPDHIGPFRIGREIGKGSFAVVHKGTTHTLTNDTDNDGSNPTKEVAIKIVTRRKLSQKLLDNLQGEIAILKEVSHPNIIELIDCLKTDSHIYLIMDYSSGGDLSQYIKRKGVLAQDCSLSKSFMAASRDYPHPPDGGLHRQVIRSFLAQLASAMEFMRVRNIVHRDIKPQNLLLGPPSPEAVAQGHPPGIPQIKVADFGFARSLPAASLAETLCGSPLYMAPEILRYEKYDAKADLWSIGAVTFEMTTGKPPFRASNHIELQRRIERNDDKIRFPDERSQGTWLKEVERRREAGEHVSSEEVQRGPTPVDDDIKALIRGLLKRRPIERMSFDDFFNNPIVVNNRTQNSTTAIDGPSIASTAAVNPSSSGVTSPHRPTPGPSLPVQPMPSSRVQAPAPTNLPPLPKFRSKYVVAQQGYGNNAKTSPSSSKTATGAGANTTAARSSNEADLKSEAQNQASPLQRKTSDRKSPSTGSPRSVQAVATQTLDAAERSSTPPRASSRTATDAAGSGAHDGESAGDDESQYVMIEKRNVEMNALADELAYAPTSQPQEAGAFATSPLAAGAISAAARLAKRPSRMSRLSTQFSAAVAVGSGSGGGGETSSAAPTSNSTQPAPSPPSLPTPPAPLPKTSPSPVTSPSAPFALPPGTRRPSFASRRTSGQYTSQLGSDSPRSRGIALESNSGSATVAPAQPTLDEKSEARAVAASPASPASVLARAISQASQKWFGVPNSLSLRSAAAFINVGMGAATSSITTGKTPHAAVTASLVAAGGEQAEAVLLIHLEDLGKKAFVLCEFADSKLSACFPCGPHQPFPFNNATQGDASIERERHQRRSPSLSSSLNSTSGASGAQQAAQAVQVANEALLIYIRSMSFLQKGVELVRGFLEARSVGSGQQQQPYGGLGAEISDAVQHLRRKFNETYERAEFARSKGASTGAEGLRSDSTSPPEPQSSPLPSPPASVNKLIYDKAMELARAAAMDELENNHDPVVVTHGNLGGSASNTNEATNMSLGETEPPSPSSGVSPETLASHHRDGSSSPIPGSILPQWDIQACLLAYETAEIMLSSLLENDDTTTSATAGDLPEQTMLTVEQFIRSISKRTQALRKRLHTPPTTTSTTTHAASSGHLAMNVVAPTVQAV
ncbi:unnamed protein product [Sympodiomycopsis kandeliae]